MTSTDYKKIVRLALARYPRGPLIAAVFQFMSDRKRAGHGPLARPRDGRGEVANRKALDWFTGRVTYRRLIDIPERLSFPPLEPMPTIDVDATNAFVTLIRTPARFVERAVQVDERDFQTQLGRSTVAALLRQLRWETRAQ